MIICLKGSSPLQPSPNPNPNPWLYQTLAIAGRHHLKPIDAQAVCVFPLVRGAFVRLNCGVCLCCFPRILDVVISPHPAVSLVLSIRPFVPMSTNIPKLITQKQELWDFRHWVYLRSNIIQLSSFLKLKRFRFITKSPHSLHWRRHLRSICTQKCAEYLIITILAKVGLLREFTRQSLLDQFECPNRVFVVRLLVADVE